MSYYSKTAGEIGYLIYEDGSDCPMPRTEVEYILNAQSCLIKKLQNHCERKIAENKRLHRDWDKIYQLCLDMGYTEEEIIKELER